MVIALFGALQVATAGEQATNAVPSKATFSAITLTNANSQPQVQPKVEPTYSTTQYKLVEPVLVKPGEKPKTSKIQRFGNESSQAWTTIATHQPNPTLVHNLSTHEPKFCVCSFGQNSWPW